MILYVDSSALVKRYIEERGSNQVNTWLGEAELVVTNIVTRTEVAAAISRAKRMKIISESGADQALEVFRAEWPHLHRLPVTELTVTRGDALACQYPLRGYDAVHLAAALMWQEAIGDSVVVTSFDAQLCETARQLGMTVLP